jgi:hypothetical protein
LFRRPSRRPRGVPGAGDTYAALRANALDAGDALPTPAPEHPRVSGVVVDVPASNGYATVVAMTDDTTSMYTSSGGGTIGAGAHAPVSTATHALLAAVDRQLDQFAPGGQPTLPPAGSVRFHVLTPEGPAAADVPEAAFWGKLDHPLMPVIAATQHVISAIREASGG